MSHYVKNLTFWFHFKMSIGIVYYNVHTFFETPFYVLV
jgi:hypothetical protein